MMCASNPDVNESPSESPSSFSRRTLLRATLLGLPAIPWSAGLVLAGQAKDEPTEQDEIAAVHTAAQKAGIEPFTVSKKEHFLGMGNAPKLFCDTALGVCESLTAASCRISRIEASTSPSPAVD